MKLRAGLKGPYEDGWYPGLALGLTGQRQRQPYSWGTCQDSEGAAMSERESFVW